MKIHLEYTAVLDACGVKSGSDMDVPDGAIVADVLNHLNVKTEHQKYVVPFVNGRKERLSAKLKDRDKLVLSLPVGGG